MGKGAGMTRYQALRKGLGLDPITAGFTAFMNWVMGVPAGIAGIMHITIEYDPNEEVEQ